MNPKPFTNFPRHRFSGTWITHPMFSGLAPLNVFHRENEPLDYSHPEDKKNLHFLFRKKFSVTPDKRCRYLIDFSADDYARIKINGRTAALGPAQGYYFYYRWNRVDVTELLRTGENMIEAEVYYQGLINRAYQSGNLRSGLVLDLLEESPEGEQRLLLKTDDTFETILLRSRLKAAPGRIWGYDTQYPEDYDSRLEPTDSDAVWDPACINPNADYIFASSPSPSVQFYERRPEIKKRQFPGQTILFCDFGEEITGTLKLKARGTAGQTVTILCGEELGREPWKVRFDMRCNCRYEEYWTLKDGENLLEQFDYKGFRYCSLLVPEHAKILEISAVVRHYPFHAEDCVLKTNDPVLSQVFDLCKRTVQYGCQETYVDCPTREKGQYLGDLTITSASHLWLTGDGRLLRKALEDFCLSVFFCPGMTAVAPGSLMQEIADYSLQFPIVALRYYEFSGDRDFLALCLKACRNIRSYFRRYRRPDGLLEQVSEKWNMVDWPENLRDGYGFPLTRPAIGPGVHNVINAFYIGFLIKMDEIEQILGCTRPQQKQEIRRLTDAFQNAFLDRKRGIYVDAELSPAPQADSASKNPAPGHASLHSNILPVYFGFYDRSCTETLTDFLLEKGMCSGVYMTWFQMKALCRLGQYDAVYHMITSTGENSWYNMIREGATTCFEAWGKNQKWNTSLCHPWATGPISVLIEDFLGWRLDGTRGLCHLPDGINAEIRLPEHFRR